MTDASLIHAAVVAREALVGWPLNYCAALDAGGPFCYIPGVRPVVPILGRIEIKAPWAAVTREEQERLEAESARAVCWLHDLASLDRELVARRTDTNDILGAINAHLCECAQVRLTWSGRTEMHPDVPKMELEATFQDWIEDRMLPDHAAHRMGPNE